MVNLAAPLTVSRLLVMAAEPRPGSIVRWLPRVPPRDTLGRTPLPGREPLGPSAGHSPAVTRRKTKLLANIKSQIKRNLQNKKAEDRNKAVKSELKTAVRRTREAIAAGDKEKAAPPLTLATKKLDKAVSKGVIHKNQAANRKSAISSQVSAL